MMNKFISFLVGALVAFPSSVIVWIFSFFPFHQGFWPSSFYALLGGGIIHFVVSTALNHQFLKKNGLTRKEYRYIKKNLEEAKRKINRLNSSFFQTRELSSMRKRIDIVRVSRKIYKLANKEPKRFYQAEQFFFSHLDSVVELTDKYALLSSQPNKNFEIEQSLRETKHTLNELSHAVEKDLHVMLSDDLDHLNFEIDVAKRNLKTLEDKKKLENNWKVKK